MLTQDVLRNQGGSEIDNFWLPSVLKLSLIMSSNYINFVLYINECTCGNNYLRDVVFDLKKSKSDPFLVETFLTHEFYFGKSSM